MHELLWFTGITAETPISQIGWTWVFLIILGVTFIFCMMPFFEAGRKYRRLRIEDARCHREREE